MQENKPLKRVGRPSKLDPYRDLVKQFIEQDPEVKAPVILQRLEEKGFEGKVTIVRDYLQKLRGQKAFPKPFLTIESPPGKQFQIDWGHFGHLQYGQTKRKLYALAVVECYSRMLYVEFTHSQKQDVLHQSLLNAFVFFQGTPEEIVVDNMLTAVSERQGILIRFNACFLEFLHHFGITPVACHIRAAHEKGKVENAIKYIRRNFWPLRSFEDLADVQLQVKKWLGQVANVRVHQTTGVRPKDRFAEVNLKSLPKILPDCRETFQGKVYKNFSIRFDCNDYTTPPWAIGKQVTIKADLFTVSIYLNRKRIAFHQRSWERKKRIELSTHRDQVKKLQKNLWQDKQVALFSSLSPVAVDYVKGLFDTRQSIRKNIGKLLGLKEEYGTTSLIYAIQKAIRFNAYGADYIENILYQEMTPQITHPPVRLKNEALNHIRIKEPSLADYDALIMERRKANDRKGS
jgi:transposase